MKFKKGDIVFVNPHDEDMDDLDYIWIFGNDHEWVYDGVKGKKNYGRLVWIKSEGDEFCYRVAVFEEMLKLGYSEMPPALDEKKTMEELASSVFDAEYDGRVAWMRRRVDEGYYTVKCSRKFREMEKTGYRDFKPWAQASRTAWADAAEIEKTRNQEIFWKDLMWAFEIQRGGDVWEDVHDLVHKREREKGLHFLAHGTYADDWYWWTEFRDFEQAYEEYTRSKADLH
jgi:hypothetical protein